MESIEIVAAFSSRKGSETVVKLKYLPFLATP